MKSSGKRLISMLIAFVMVFAAIIIYSNLTVPAYTALDERRAELNSLDQLYARKEKAIADVQSVLKDYDSDQKLKGLQDVISSSLPNNPQQSEILNQVRAIAGVNQLSLTDMSLNVSSIQNVAAKATSTQLIKPVAAISMQFKVIGYYADIKNFISSLENNLRIMDIRSITIDPLGKPDQDYYRADLTVITYYQSK
jgi:Tfp pilus assembly protein PilO